MQESIVEPWEHTGSFPVNINFHIRHSPTRGGSWNQNQYHDEDLVIYFPSRFFWGVVELWMCFLENQTPRGFDSLLENLRHFYLVRHFANPEEGNHEGWVYFRKRQYNVRRIGGR